MNQVFSSKVVRYLISGAIATVVDIASLSVLVDVFSVWYLASSAIAFTLTMCVSFVLQKFWTFGESSTESLHKQMGWYLSLSLANIFVNTFFMYVMVGLLHIHYLLAQLVAIAVISLYGFFVYKYLIFRAPLGGL